MKFGKVSFFKRLYLAIADFRLYPYSRKEKLTTAVGYFLKLIILMSIIIAAFFTTNVFEELPMVISISDRMLPDFNVVNGVFDAKENTTREINDDWYLIVNDEISYKELNTITFEENQKHDFYVFVLADATTIGMLTEDGIAELGGFIYEPNMSFTKTQMLTFLEDFYESSAGKITVWVVSSMVAVIVLLIVRLWTLVMYIMSIFIINIMFGVHLKWQDYCKVAIYVSTLPILLETLAIVTVGGSSESINFVIVAISCVYIFYALRALKLDSFIIDGTGKTAEEKLKNALAHAQKELEKQLAELEKEEAKEKKNERKLSKEEEDELNKELYEKEEKLLQAQKEYEEAMERVIKKMDEEEEKENEEEK